MPRNICVKLGTTTPPAGTDAYSTAVINDSPIAYWRLGESAGSPAETVALDVFGNNGTYINNPALGQQALIANTTDTSVSFTAVSSQYITIPDNDIFSFTNGTNDLPFSIEAWINPTSLVLDLPIFSKTENSLINITNEYYVRVNTLGAVVIYLTTDNADPRAAINQYIVKTPDGTITANNSYHIVATYSGVSGGGKIYVNGVEMANAPIIGTSYVKMRNTSTPPTIGTYFINEAALNEWFDGNIDEVAIYNFELSPAQVVNHYDIGTNTYSSLIVNDNPISYWRLGESSGLTAVDAIGTNNGVYTNGPTLGVQGLIGNDIDTAVNFDSASPSLQYVNVNNALAGTVTDYSIEAWINLASISTGWQTIAYRVGIALYIKNGLIDFYYAGSHFGNTTLTANTIYHIVLVVSGSTATFYLDAINDGTAANPPLLDFTRIGSSSAGNEAWDGVIDEVAVYDYALSLTQIQAHYNKGRTILTTYFDNVIADSPIAYWRLGEASGTTAVEEISSRNGTYLSLPTLGVNGLISSDLDTAVSFNGINNQVSIADDNIFSFTNGANDLPFTIEAWVKPTSLADVNPIFAKALDGTVTTVNEYAINIGTDGSILAVIFSGVGNDQHSWTTAGPIQPIAINDVYHIVITYTGTTSSGKTYVNGVSLPVNYASAGYTGMNNTNTQPAIGSQLINDLSFNKYFAGTIDEVAIYNYELSASNIQRHYNAGLGSYFNVVINDTPLAYWRLGDLVGTAAVEEINGNDGIYVSNPTLGTPGLINDDQNTAVLFTNSNYVNVDAAASLVAAVTVLTIECWFTTTSTPITDAGNIIFSTHTSSSTNVFRFGTAINGGIFVAQASNNNVFGTGYNNGSIHHLVIDISGVSGDYNLYVDGFLLSNGSLIAPDLTNVALVSIAQEYDSGAAPGDYFDGVIDEVALYNYALSLSEVQNHYNVGKTTSIYRTAILFDSPIGYWVMDDGVNGANSIILDETTNNNDLSTFPGPTYQSGGLIPIDPNTLAVDYSSGAAADASINTTLGEVTTEFTLECWAQLNSVGSFQQGICRQSASTTIDTYSLYLNSTDSTFFARFNDSTNTEYIVGTTRILDTDPHYFTATFDGFDLKIYFDGNPEGIVYTSPVTVIPHSGQNFVVGAGYFSSASLNNKTDGIVDEVAIYNYALTDAQIKNHYNVAIGSFYRTVTDDTPKFHFKLDDTSGPVVEDISSGVESLTTTSMVFNKAAQVENKFGIEFNGITSFAQGAAVTAGAYDLDPASTSGFAIEIICKFLSVGTSLQTLIHKGHNASGGNQSNYAVYKPTNNTLVFERYDGGFASVTTTNPVIVINKWHHIFVVGTTNGVNVDIVMYVDGEVVASSPSSLSQLVPNASATIPLTIGAVWDGTLSEYAHVIIDEMIVYEHTVSRDRITKHWNAANLFQQVEWDAINKGTQVGLSNNNLTAFPAIAGHSAGTATPISGKNSGKWYWETKVDYIAGGGTVVSGIARFNVSKITGNWLGIEDNAIGTFIQNGSGVFRNSIAIVATIGGTQPSGTVIGHKLDLDTGRYDITVDGFTYIQVDAGTDLTGTWYPAYSTSSSGDAVTMATAISDLVYTVPTGYTLLNTPTTPDTVAPGYDALILGSVPAGYFRLGEVTGTIARDSSTNINDGTWFGTTNLGVAGLISNSTNKAATFNGTNAYIRSAVNTVYDVTTENFSVDVWVKVAALAASSMGIVDKRGEGGVGGYGYICGVTSTGAPFLAVNDISAYVQTTATQNINDGNIHYLAFNFDRAGNGDVWIDGVLQASASITAAAGNLSNTNLFTTGFSSPTGGTLTYFNGTMDELSITPLNVLLTPKQIRDRYYLGSGYALINQDDFTGSNGDLVINRPVWSQEAGVFSNASPTAGSVQISNNKLIIANDNNAILTDAGTQGVIIEVDFAPAVGTLNRSSIIYRYATNNNHGSVQLREDNGDIRIANYNASPIYGQVAFAWVEGQTYHVSVRINSSGFIEVYVDDILRVTGTDGSIGVTSSTRVGLSRNTGSSSTAFDNFEVRTYK